MSTHEAPALTDWLTERFPPGRARAPSAAESGLSARDGHGTRGYGERELPGSEIRLFVGMKWNSFTAAFRQLCSHLSA